MFDHFISKNSTAHKVNSSCTLAISYCTFCVGKHTILGPATKCSSGGSALSYSVGPCAYNPTMWTVSLCTVEINACVARPISWI